MTRAQRPAANAAELPLRAAIVPVTPFQQNCTILWCTATKRAVVVDPGGDVPNIMSAIEQLMKAPEGGITVERIWLTHGHIDHAGGAADLKAALGGVPIEGPHEADRFLLEGIEKQARSYGLGGVRNVMPDRWLKEGETAKLGDLSFDLYHCPGHSPGSIVFVNVAARFALVGDVLFQGSIGRTDFPYGDHDALIGAIKTKLIPLGDDITFVCGHGEPSTFGQERQTNPFIQ
jgi:glyoxylase-like metal-dependent hydrolase (beta-lactamase superfamily II)